MVSLGWVIDCAVPFAWWQRLPRYSSWRYESEVSIVSPGAYSRGVGGGIASQGFNSLFCSRCSRAGSSLMQLATQLHQKSILQLAKNAAVSHRCPLRRQLGGVSFQGSGQLPSLSERERQREHDM